jgi:hypothetical protein
MHDAFSSTHTKAVCFYGSSGSGCCLVTTRRFVEFCFDSCGEWVGKEVRAEPGENPLEG